MRKACVFGVDVQVTPAIDHEVAKPTALGKALAALRAQTPANLERLATCKAAFDQEMARQLDQAEALIWRGKSNDAKALLLRIDARYGGLARTRILDLTKTCDCGIFPSDGAN
jgi:hypothetical protein